MKAQKARAAGGRKPDQVVANQRGTTASSSKPARPLFDDLHGGIAIRAYELYVQRGCREGFAVQDWVDAEQEIMAMNLPSPPVRGEMLSCDS